MGRKQTEETKIKISKSLKGKPSFRKGMTGLKHSEETKKKMSAIGLAKSQKRWEEGKIVERDTIRKHLAKRDGYKCSICGIIDWQGEPITLHVDHINGDPSNHNPENLRLICPNCDSQTPFYGARNKGNGRKSRGMSLK